MIFVLFAQSLSLGLRDLVSDFARAVYHLLPRSAEGCLMPPT